MFTFGREPELAHVLKQHKGQHDVGLLLAVVESVHDLIDGATTVTDDVELAVRTAIVEGSRHIWDKAGGWLLKVERDFPQLERVWMDLAEHPNWAVRFRIASFIVDLPHPLSSKVYEHLREDKSKRVREHAAGKWDFRQHPENYGN